MKSETQRHGEQPQFDERANEDGYFAVKEHELVEDMKSEFRKVEVARRDAQLTTCPKCSGKLEKCTVKGSLVERCENCEGIWLDKGGLTEILRRQAAGPLGAFIERCFAKVEVTKKS
jgi:hypothetical protein